MKKKRLCLSSFVLKIVALVCMTLDHAGAFIVNDYAPSEVSPLYITFMVFRILGRLAFPLFAFMLAEGMMKTHDRLNYLLRIAIIWGLVIIAEIIMGFIPSLTNLATPNAFTDLIIGASFIYLIEQKDWKKYLAVLPAAYAVGSYVIQLLMNQGYSLSIPYYLLADYSLFGFLSVLGFYYAYKISDILAKRDPNLSNLSLDEIKKTPSYRALDNMIGSVIFVLLVVIFWGIHYFFPALDPYNMGYESYGLLAVILVLLYNGKRGYDAKWFRYAEYLYYPLHLALLALLFALL